MGFEEIAMDLETDIVYSTAYTRKLEAIMAILIARIHSYSY